MTDSASTKFRAWQALRDVCRDQHGRRPGGAMQCICGQGGGGSEACGALGLLRDLIRYLPTDSLPAEWKSCLDEWRAVV